MTRQVQEKRHRKLAALAVAAIMGTGLVAPVLYDSPLTDMSLSSAVVNAATRDSYTLTSPLALPLMPNVMIETGRLSVTSSNPKQPLTGAEAVALLSAGKAKLVLDDAILSLTPTQPSDAAAPKGTSALAPVLEALLKVSFSQLQLRNAIVQLGRNDDERAVLTDVALEVTKLGSSQVRVAGSFVFRKEPVTFDISMGTQAELQAAQSQGKATIGRAFDIKLASKLIDMKAGGTLSAGDQPQLSSSTSTLVVSNLREFAQWIGLELGKGGGLGAFEARGPLEFSPTAIAFSDATFSLDRNEATGALTFKWGGRQRPSIDGTLAFKSFDIAPFVLPPGKLPPGAPLPAFKVSDFFDLSATKQSSFPLADQIDADLRISAANVTAGAIRFGRGAASLSLKDGMLLADLAELEIGKGGHCGGQFGLKIDNGAPHYSLRGKIESVDLATLTNALWSYSVLAGTGDVTLDLKANGSGIDQLISSMSGKVGVRQTGNGQIGLDLRTLAATTRAQTQKGWGSATRAQTAIQSMSADFTMANGQLIAEQIAARAGDAALSAEGSLSFADKIGDVKVWITHPANNASQTESDPATAKPTAASAAAIPTPDASAGDAAAAPKDVHAPGGGLHILGPLDAPQIRFIPIAPPASNDTGDSKLRAQ